MAKPQRNPLGGADSRPRVFVRPMMDGYAWRAGVQGIERAARSPGEAVDAAIQYLSGEDCVIIFGREI